jgi:hypothetical protein
MMEAPTIVATIDQQPLLQPAPKEVLVVVIELNPGKALDQRRVIDLLAHLKLRVSR